MVDAMTTREIAAVWLSAQACAMEGIKHRSQMALSAPLVSPKEAGPAIGRARHKDARLHV